MTEYELIERRVRTNCACGILSTVSDVRALLAVEDDRKAARRRWNAIITLCTLIAGLIVCGVGWGCLLGR